MPLLKSKNAKGETVLNFALDRVGKDAVEVLELSYNDIPYHWICGTLTRECILNGYKKPEGCALGLVGMNAGLAQYYVKEVEKFDDLIKTYVKTGEIQIQAHQLDQSDMYGNEITAEAIMCLFLAIPESWLSRKQGWSEHVDEAYHYMVDNIQVPEAADTIVSYNDGEITRGEAASWFCNAIGIARQRREDGVRMPTWYEDGDE
jgi:hypothetical protein